MAEDVYVRTSYIMGRVVLHMAEEIRKPLGSSFLIIIK